MHEGSEVFAVPNASQLSLARLQKLEGCHHRIYNTHLRSDCHKERCEILELRNTTSDVAEQLSKKYKEENELNWMMLIKILQTVLFLARQGLPF